MITGTDQTKSSRIRSPDASKVDVLLDKTIGLITTNTGNGDLYRLVAEFGRQAATLPSVQREIARNAACNHLRDELKVPAPTKLIDAALKEAMPWVETKSPNGQSVSVADTERWPAPVHGEAVLTDVSDWLRRYVSLPAPAADAISLWVAATWFVKYAYYAPILAVLSATKRCGKSLLLDLLKHIVRRGYLTSGSGITAPVVFRLNEKVRPTFLIDEAERLSGRHADRDLIGLLNTGYRRGAKVSRCAEKGGAWEVEEYDAFGFRGVAAIGTLWDTILDRAVIVRLERKRKGAKVARFGIRLVEPQGLDLARRLSRWADDNGEKFSPAEESAPRPEWLHDRECDNWSSLFAVASLAGGAWPKRAMAAAKALSPDPTEDYSEQLIHAVRQVFENMGSPEAIQSGELASTLSDIETGPWADMSAHSLARLIKPFGVRPKQRRRTDGAKVRGYWLGDLRPVFERYPAPSGTPGTVGQQTEDSQENGRGVPLVPRRAVGTEETPEEAERRGLQDGL